ncbi:MAG: hypothetical protein IB616_01280 [Methanosarcinales archaeon]|nr:MAG: hypothetical protein IB616_01280 [Methanosarcinales archaeon]
MPHPLHKIIGDFINDSTLPSCKIIKDTACGGNQHIPLFCSKDKSNQTKYCEVDLLILKDNKIRVIIEIEEADVKPRQICGKFLASALSAYFIHYKHGKQGFEMDESVSFIQILDTSKLKNDEPAKIEQWKNIEKSIKNIMPIKGSKIKEYKLFFCDASGFRGIRNEIVNYIKEALK